MLIEILKAIKVMATIIKLIANHRVELLFNKTPLEIRVTDIIASNPEKIKIS